MGEYIEPHSVFVRNGHIVSWNLPHGGGEMKTERDKRILQAIDDYNRLVLYANERYLKQLWHLNEDGTVSINKNFLRKYIITMKDATQLLEEIESECR